MKLFGHEWTFRKSANPNNFFEATIDTEKEETALALYVYAVHVVTDMIASIVSNVEFKTYGKNEEEKKSVIWTKMNVHPNNQQTSTEFMKKLTKKLLLGECLIVEVRDQYFVADSFSKEEKVVVDSIFTNVTVDGYTFKDKFKSSDVIYMKYGNESINAILHGIVDMYERLMSNAADKYARSGEEKGILKIDQQARGVKDFETVYEELINKHFKTFFSRGNHVLPLFNGYNYTSNTAEATKKYSNEISDLKTLFEEAISRVAQAFKVPVGLIRGDVAGVKEAYNMLLTNCIDPICHMIGEEFTFKVYSESQIIDGYAIEADTTNIKHIDIFDLAGNIDKLIACGFLSIDEARQKSGLRGLDEEWSKVHFMTLNYTTAEAAIETAAESQTANEGSEEE